MASVQVAKIHLFRELFQQSFGLPIPQCWAVEHTLERFLQKGWRCWLQDGPVPVINGVKPL